MFLHFKNILKVLKKAFKSWWDRDPAKASAVISYSAVFSLPGLLVVVVTLAGYFFGSEMVSQQLHTNITKAMGEDTAVQIEQMIVLASKSRDSIWATILGILTIIIGATGVFVQMQKYLNIIWEVKASTKKSGIWIFIKKRLFSFGLIMSIGFLLLISLVITSLLAAAGDWIRMHTDSTLNWLFNILNSIASLGIITVLFAMMFKVLPDAKIKWRYVWIGAFATALLFEIGKTLLGLYFGKATPGSGYGAAGSIILILLWTSYSSMIVFFGAEFTKAYSDVHFGKVPANEIAVKDKGREV